ncbi:NAD-dependent aldehyde dehydrogenase [Caulobacter sp. AP07]|uniref:aldehyde dehydrogenase n=1 Tax=Caulobacter sp. AP07 TaxID=1144304 RepID=UPI000271F2A8|nr:aldehyde dehydrogenase [Caulobacter sp. AP07]EJL30827.1 NAD-dependent aldehyde dehydrogenase [Caulobacter sp. AP07]
MSDTPSPATTTSARFERLDPVTGLVASTAAAMTIDEVIATADRAQAALANWGAVGPTPRRALLSKAADALEAKTPAIVEAMMSEIGSTQGWARRDVMNAAATLREAAALTTQVCGDVMPSDRAGSLSLAIREPAGVVLGIAPWNAPVTLGMRAIATPLACGNTVVLKASETCPRTHGLIVEAFVEAGLPDGVVNLVTNAPQDAAQIVAALIDHPAVRRINFTGSTAVGKIIARRAAEHLKPVLLELGGKAPLLVLEDADLDEAVKAAAFGAFLNQGQICMSTERIIAVDGVADAFVEKFRAKVATLDVGDPRAGAAALGAVVDLKTVAHVESLVASAIASGAVRVNGGAATGVLMPATVIDRVTSEMALFREESFGPVVAIIRARDEDHAVQLANDTDYGLSAAVFTRDIARGLALARRIKSGMCHVNGSTVRGDAHAPFGGLKGSGYGRFGGQAGIDAFTELRWITVETQPGHYPI